MERSRNNGIKHEHFSGDAKAQRKFHNFSVVCVAGHFFFFLLFLAGGLFVMLKKAGAAFLHMNAKCDKLRHSSGNKRISSNDTDTDTVQRQ